MTCITTDGRTMAADGQCQTSFGVINDTSRAKIAKLRDGRIAGMAGLAYDLSAFIGWLEAGEPKKVPEFYEEMIALVLMLDGTVRSYNHQGRWVVDMIPTATGSGSELAIGAMEAGASPRVAVEIACRRHNGCGGAIVECRL